jgi:bifunctional non-homologous end joining protein LigD
MHARIDGGRVRLLTRRGLDWTERYGATEEALKGLACERAFDGELCAVRPDGTTSFAAMQAATDIGRSSALIFYFFDLLHLDRVEISKLLLLERKARLHALLSKADQRIVY